MPATVVALGADRDAAALKIAAQAGIATFQVRPEDFPDRALWDRALTKAVAAFNPDFVVSAGFMRVLGPEFLAQFEGRTINTHPALLPAFPGAHAVRDALAAGVSQTGCTVHWVDAGVDTGPVIAQRQVKVLPDDDESTLHERIKTVERTMLVETIERLASGDLKPLQPRLPVRRALISVYDKSGIETLAARLHELGVEIVSTGSTAGRIRAAGIPVTAVEDVTGSPECLDGRVKTLHPRIHAGILADLRVPAHKEYLEAAGIVPFGLVVVNLYPFEATVASGASRDECIEQIDIGGPAMVRAAAKNHPSVAIVTDPSDYSWAAEQIAAGGFTLDERTRLARDAFRHTATYDVAVATWLSPSPDGAAQSATQPAASPSDSWLGGAWQLASELRYGENPHQSAAVYGAIGGVGGHRGTGLAYAEQLGGKPMSYNNYVDAEAARRAAFDFAGPAVAVVKHTNPCGIAIGRDIADAHAKAHACDPVSAYGGVIAANRPVTLAMAEQVKPIFTEVIIAPAYENEALELLRTKASLRILQLDGDPGAASVELRAIQGGLLVQQRDRIDAPGDDPANWTQVAGPAADAATMADLEFAWRAVRAVKSNAILLAAGGASVGVGMGQVNRVDAAYLAVRRAGPDRARGAVAASDAFFPFADGLEILIEAGVRAVVHPGGSIRDGDVTAAAEAAGLMMFHTGTRHFNH
jgi:phosphoribosylaminoimidazolecarboxamide formyltransferase/IMP cyclohydrolase